MEISTLFALSFGCMFASCFTPVFNAVWDSFRENDRIKAEAVRSIDLADQALTEMIFDTSYSLHQILNHFESHKDQDDMLTSHRTQTLMLTFKQELAFSAAYFAISDAINRANPEQLESEKKEIETFLAMFLKIQVHEFSIARDVAIDDIKEEIFFAFAQLDLDGKIPEVNTLTNLADTFFAKPSIPKDAADKTQ